MTRKQTRVTPITPVGHPNFKWTSGSDVQATWRKYGWTPPSEKMTPPPVVQETPPWAQPKQVRRVK